MKLRWTRRAIDDLNQIADHFAQYDPIAAENRINRILDRCQLLIDQPYQGKHPTAVTSEEVRTIVVDQFKITYEIWDPDVTITRVFDWRQHPDRESR